MLAHKLKNTFTFALLIGVFAELISQFDLDPKIRKKDPTGVHFSYRGNQIRTDDILLPKQTLYQAELHPEYRQI